VIELRIRTATIAGALLLAPLAIAPAQTVVVVRHAEKASEIARDPILSAAGQARAAALDSALANSKLTAIVVTQYQRTSLTAAVAARRHGLVPIEVAVAGAIGDHAQAIAREVRRHQGTVLVVGHSNTIDDIVAALGGPADIGDLPDSVYSAMFIVTPTGTARVSFGAR